MPRTVESLVNDVFRKLRQSSGRDVQLHSQDFVVQEIQDAYRYYNQRFLFRDYLKRTDLTTQSDGTLSSEQAEEMDLTEYADIVAVFLRNNEAPLAHLPAVSNVGDAYGFKVYATGDRRIFGIANATDLELSVINKSWIRDDFDLDTEITFFYTLLIVHAAKNLADMVGMNDSGRLKLDRELAAWIDVHTANEMLTTYSTSTRSGDVPTEWFTY